MPNGETNNLMISFPVDTSVTLPGGASLTFPQGQQPPISLEGSGITISFPAGSGITIPERHNIEVFVPGQTGPIDLSSTVEGNVQVTLPGQGPITLQPTSPMGAVIPELSPPPLQLPAGSSISLAPGAPPFQLSSPTTVGIRRIKLQLGPGPID